MKQLNANLFSGPAFALDQYRDVGFGYFFYFVSNWLCKAGVLPKRISIGGRLKDAADSPL